MNDGDFGYEIEVRRFEELMEKKVHSRTSTVHFDCYMKVSRTNGSYLFDEGDGEIHASYFIAR